MMNCPPENFLKGGSPFYSSLFWNLEEQQQLLFGGDRLKTAQECFSRCYSNLVRAFIVIEGKSSSSSCNEVIYGYGCSGIPFIC